MADLILDQWWQRILKEKADSGGTLIPIPVAHPCRLDIHAWFDRRDFKGDRIVPTESQFREQYPAIYVEH